MSKSTLSPTTLNDLGQPIGFPLPGWAPPPRPQRSVHHGRSCTLEPLDPAAHANEVFEALSADRSGALWTYLPYGPFESVSDYSDWMRREALGEDPLFFAIRETRTQRVIGVTSYLRIFPNAGSIEIGHLQFSPVLQRTPAATESVWLLLRGAFALGYRRCEWKCDALHAKSRAAAQRYGFSFEGIFRQALVYKSRNRDTAWYSILDREWSARDQAMCGWLAEDNFDPQGSQRRRLAAFMTEQGVNPVQ